MREGIESGIEIGFDCGATGSVSRRPDPTPMQFVRLETVSGQVTKTALGQVTVPLGQNLLCVNLKGTLVCRVGPTNRLVLVPPKHLVYARGVRMSVQAARGEHETRIVSWGREVTPLLERWIEARNVARGDRGPRVIGCKSIEPNLRAALNRFDKAISDGNDLTEPQVVSFLYEVTSRLMAGADQVQIAIIPNGLPETITDLIRTVRANPSEPWPLRDAADRAGYSPFHFSRVFKNLVGYGFHEYVDRCRTESAVDMLCTTESPVDMVATSCGFGTTQGLRESVKDYLGLVPSELRATPEPPEPLT